MSATYCSIRLHIVFSTKLRMNLISPDVLPRLLEYTGGVIRGMGGTPLGLGGMADHIHALVAWRTDKDVASLVREMKSESSRWIHSTFRNLRHFAWQEGYGVFSVSASQSDAVLRYIRNQQTHHSRRSYEEELRRLLEAHGEADGPDRYLG